MPSQFNHTGQKFGKLLVLGLHHHDPKTGYYWLCRCECGNTCTPNGTSLRARTSKSCGCERTRRFVAAIKKHGMSHSRTYNTWVAMKQRCLNPNSDAYVNYGGRGITICMQWLESFENFYADMGECPKSKTIERRNNDGNYECDNCYWATKKQQQRNLRNSRRITAFGETKTLGEWAEIYSIAHNVISHRLKNGYSTEEAIALPRFARYGQIRTKHYSVPQARASITVAE